MYSSQALQKQPSLILVFICCANKPRGRYFQAQKEVLKKSAFLLLLINPCILHKVLITSPYFLTLMMHYAFFTYSVNVQKRN